MESFLNPIAFATLLTSLFVLRFRGWTRPLAVGVYFVFFASIELVAAKFFLPPGAFGLGLSYVCFGLTIPVLIAAYLVRRHEIHEGEVE